MKRKQLIELIGDMATVIRQSRSDLYETHKYPCGMVHDKGVEDELSELDALLDRAAKVEPK